MQRVLLRRYKLRIPCLRIPRLKGLLTQHYEMARSIFIQILM